jgi:hypothetical protein
VLRGKAVRATRRDALGKTGMIADASFAAHGSAGGNPGYIPSGGSPFAHQHCHRSRAAGELAPQGELTMGTMPVTLKLAGA